MQYVVWARHIKDNMWIDISIPNDMRYSNYVKDREEKLDINGDHEYRILPDHLDPNDFNGENEDD